MTANKPNISPFKAIVFSFLAIIGSSLFTLLAVEIGLRLFNQAFMNLIPQFMIIDTAGELFFKSEDESLLYEMRPNIQTEALGKITKTNSLGFRDRDYSLTDDPEVFRIIGLGDSIAFGLDMELEKSYHKLIEAELNRDGFPVEVVNCAVPGYNMVQYYTNYINKAHRYKPDLVLVSYFSDDFFQVKIPKRAEYWKQLLEAYSHFYKFIHQRLRAVDAKKTDDKLQHFYTNQAAVEEGKRALLKLYQQLKSEQVGLYVIVHPTLEDSYKQHFTQYVIDALEGTDVPVLDLFPFYQATGQEIRSFRLPRLIDKDFTHPGENANQLIARWVLDDWRKRGSLPGWNADNIH